MKPGFGTIDQFAENKILRQGHISWPGLNTQLCHCGLQICSGGLRGNNNMHICKIVGFGKLQNLSVENV